MTMTTDELQSKYDRLFVAVRRMRGHQKEWFRWHAKVNLDAARRLEREVDKLIDQEVKFRKSCQIDLF